MNMCSKFPPPVRTHHLRWSRHWSNAVSMMSWSKSNQVCIKRFQRSSVPWIFVSYTHCCTTALINKLKAYDDMVSFGEAMIHLMQCSLVISRCYITFSGFWLSQGSVATVIRWGGWRSYHHVTFICKSNSENCKKIRWFLTKLQKK